MLAIELAIWHVIRRTRLLLPALAVLAPFLLLEISLRLAGPHVPSVGPLLYFPKIAHRYDQVRTLEELLDTTVLGFQPNTQFLDFVLNSRSFRTREYAEEKAPGTLRVLAIGDSFTFALNVPYEQCWTVRLQEALQARTDAKVEVLNLGVPDVGPEFEMRLFELEGAKLHADVVVVAFPVGSNFYASARLRREWTWSERFARWSYSFRFVRNVVRLRASRPPGKAHGPEQNPLVVTEGKGGVTMKELVGRSNYRYEYTRPNMSASAFANLESSHLRVCYGTGMGEMFESTTRTLVRFGEEVAATGAEFVVMICPAELQTGPKFLERALASGKPVPEGPGARVDAPQEFLKRAFDEQGMRYLDLLPAFREATGRQVSYGLLDSHWNPEGNALAAETLCEYLTKPPASGRPWPWQHLVK